MSLSAEAAKAALQSVSLPDLIRVEILAKHIGLTPGAVRKLLREGKLPGKRIGRRWIISRRQLLAFLDNTEELLLLETARKIVLGNHDR